MTVDRSYRSVVSYREIMQAVTRDPRVIAAKAALDAFNASDTGVILHAACHGDDWREKMAGIDEDVKDRWEAHESNHYRTRSAVKQELIIKMRQEAGK
jgi:mono/diheme cytochrome c family protein